MSHQEKQRIFDEYAQSEEYSSFIDLCIASQQSQTLLTLTLFLLMAINPNGASLLSTPSMYI